MSNLFKNDPIIRAIVTIILVTLAIGLIFYLFGRPAGFGMYGYGEMGGYGNNYGGMMGGYAGSLGGLNFGNIIGTLFQILLALSVLGLVVGLAVYLYQLIVKRDNNSTAVVSGTAASTACANCSARIPADAHFCPACGTKVKPAE